MTSIQFLCIASLIAIAPHINRQHAMWLSFAITAQALAVVIFQAVTA